MIPKLKELPQLEMLICLVKPQFECGKEIADKYRGVIKNKTVHQQVLQSVLSTFEENGFFVHQITFSPIQGGSGNIEYLVQFKRQPTNFEPPLSELIETAFQSVK